VFLPSVDGEAGTVLIVEPDELVALSTRMSLLSAGFNVVEARSAAEVRECVSQLVPDLVLLDSPLPDDRGVALCRWIRENSSAMVFLASNRASDAAVVADGLDAGADDYLAKPYRSAELVARIRATLRRAPEKPTDPLCAARAMITGDVVIDTAGHAVYVRGERMELPLREFDVLAVLVAAMGAVVTRTELMRQVWGEVLPSGTKSLDVHIKRLRSRIESDPAKPERILTVRGIGYRFKGGT